MTNLSDTLAERYNRVRDRIRRAAREHSRNPNDIRLLAVSKTRPDGEIRALARLGQRAFGESYLQEALEKIVTLQDLGLEWHFIGRLQSNKTRPIAEHFAWVHSLASLKHAQRLNDQRPPGHPPLNVCIQVNTSGEQNKGGHQPGELEEFFEGYTELPNLKIQGLMTIPAPAQDIQSQRRPFKMLRELRDRLRTHSLPLETLSMGMSDDLEAAIAEGANLVRIGTAIFGPRQYNVNPKPINRLPD
ncbi:MAG: YggS family pyridoxal phosphate-dependent enzyme [Chromatiales bacterium]